MKDHPLAELFPIMDDADIQALADDITANGLRAPITLLEGKILDGRNRFRACGLAKVEPKTRNFGSGDPLQFVLSANLHRRHLTESQRAMVAARIATLGRGKSANLPNINSSPSTANGESAKITQEKAAEKLQVSTRSVTAARAVLANPKLAQQVDRGEKTIAAAAKELKAKKEAKEIQRDETGYAIPSKILPLWNRRGEISDVLREIGKARGALREIMDKMKEGVADDLFEPANVSGAYGRLNDAWTMVSMALPYAVCAGCQGMAAEDCKLCKGRGFISKHTFEHAVSKELREVREKSCVK